MKRIALILSAFACGLLARELVPADARADSTIVLQSSGVAWDTMLFRPNPDVTGGVLGRVCGHTTLASGGVSDGWCVDTVLAPANQTAIDVTALGNTKGNQILKTAKPGL